jgi:hypothetical protein
LDAQLVISSSCIDAVLPLGLPPAGRFNRSQKAIGCSLKAVPSAYKSDDDEAEVGTTDLLAWQKNYILARAPNAQASIWDGLVRTNTSAFAPRSGRPKQTAEMRCRLFLAFAASSPPRDLTLEIGNFRMPARQIAEDMFRHFALWWIIQVYSGPKIIGFITAPSFAGSHLEYQRKW